MAHHGADPRQFKPCYEFQREGRCHRGQSCAFMHGAPAQRHHQQPHQQGGGYRQQHNHYHGDQPFHGGHGRGGYGGNTGGPHPRWRRQDEVGQPHHGQQGGQHHPHNAHHHHHHHRNHHGQHGQHGQHGHGGHHKQQNGAGSDGKPGPWLPPGATGRKQTLFGANLDPNFVVPKRLRNKSADLVDAVNDWHYAMVNDSQRNEFYRESLRQIITPQSRVLEIGTGTGLLAMLAAKLGAEWVVAVEANVHMAELARGIIAKNGYSDRITVLHKMSTELTPQDLPSAPNVLVSEVFGTLLLGESVLHYVHDCRERLLAPDSHIVPPRGVQHATLIECPAVRSITSVSTWDGFELDSLNSLQDTATTVFTKQYGFRLASAPHTKIADPVPLIELDFRTAQPDPPPRLQRYPVVAKETGVIHAVMLSWEVCSADGTLTMSTAPEHSSFQRDLQWGQAIQLIEDHVAAKDSDVPVPFQVTAGEQLELIARFSADGVMVQFQLERVGKK